MPSSRTVESAMRMMKLNMLILIIGGLVILGWAIETRNYSYGGMVAWVCGAGSAIYSSAIRAIKALKAQIADSGQMSSSRTVESAKRIMKLGMLMVIIGGLVILGWAVATRNYSDGGVVVLLACAGSAINSSAIRAIKALEAQIAGSNRLHA